MRWRVFLSGKRVRTFAAERKFVLRKRVYRTGRYRWTVQGIDVNGRSVISSSRRFRACAVAEPPGFPPPRSA